MKNVFAVLLLFAVSLPLFAQRITPSAYSRHDDYILKSNRRERAGIILLGTGAAVTAGGTILLFNGINRSNRSGDYNGNGELNAGEAEMVLGVLIGGLGIGSMCASIPFFVGAHRARKKALLSLKTETTPQIYKLAFSRQLYPALALHIPLGK